MNDEVSFRDCVLNGNCLEILKEIPSGSVDLIFADPPYWMRVSGELKRVEGTTYDGCNDEWDNQFNSLADYERFTLAWLTECKRVLARDGSLWVIGGMQCIHTIGSIMQQLGFWIISDVIWHKKNPTPNFRGTRLNNSHETLIWATQSDRSSYTFNYKTAKELNTDTVAEAEYADGIRKQLGSVWSIAVCQGSERLKDEQGMKLHSTQKPELLLYRILAISTKPGDLVLDPFGGTMTTGVVAKRMGRHYIMIESNAEYCKYGEERLAHTEAALGDIELATFDIKPLRVSLPQMIAAGYLQTGETFYLKNSEQRAVLQADAKLLYLGERYDIHACAARASGKRAERLNGFAFWYLLRDGELVSLDEVRKAYRRSFSP